MNQCIDCKHLRRCCEGNEVDSVDIFRSQDDCEDFESITKHETVEQWEQRTGESYPDDAPVWTYSPCSQEWQLYTIKELEHTICETIIVANHHGKPEIEG